jgi:L-2-hydroxyglutarate oxidase LhgO
MACIPTLIVWGGLAVGAAGAVVAAALVVAAVAAFVATGAAVGVACEVQPIKTNIKTRAIATKRAIFITFLH